MTKTELQRENYKLSTQLKAYIHCYENCSAELHELKMKHDTEYAKQQRRRSEMNYQFEQRYPHRVID